MVFPKPPEGATVDLSPPGFVWLPAEDASGYRVEIRDASGELAYENELGAHPEHLPFFALAPKPQMARPWRDGATA